MSTKLPNAMKKILEDNQTIIKKILGDAFFNRVLIGDITHIDLQRIEKIVRAAALSEKQEV